MDLIASFLTDGLAEVLRGDVLLSSCQTYMGYANVQITLWLDDWRLADVLVTFAGVFAGVLAGVLAGVFTEIGVVFLMALLRPDDLPTLRFSLLVTLAIFSIDWNANFCSVLGFIGETDLEGDRDSLLG